MLRKVKKKYYLENKLPLLIPLPGLGEQLSELGLGTLLRVEQTEHHDIHAAHDLFVPGVFLPRPLKQAVIINNDAGARLEGGDEVAEDLERVGGRVIVEDPAEEVDVRLLGHLLGKEIVRQQRDPLGDLSVGRDRLRRAVDRLLQVLHDKLHVLPPLRQGDAHEAVAAAHVDQRSPPRVNLTEVIPASFHVDEPKRLVALPARQRHHRFSHALGSVGVLAKGDKHGFFVDGVEGKLEPGPGEGGGLGVGLQGLEDVGGGGEDVLPVEADPGLEVRVLCQDPGGGRVGDEAGGGLVKDLVGDGETDQTGEVDGIERGFGLEVGEGDGGVEGNELGDAIVVDGGEGEGVKELEHKSVL